MKTRGTIWICVLGLVLAAQTASAQGAVDIGGKASVTALGSVTTIDPDEGEDVTALVLGGFGAYTTENGRFEVGGGLTIVGAFSDIGDAAIYSLTGQARINTDPLGPEENLLLYLGGIAGLGILRGDGNIDDEVGVFGPKAGLEFYVSPQTAIQVQEALLFDSEGGLSNQLTLGFKFLFN
jgi:hypothetical protein